MTWVDRRPVAIIFTDQKPNSSSTCIVNNIFLDGLKIRFEALALGHLSDLEIDVEPKLFSYYPKPYSTAREFVGENLELQRIGTFLPVSKCLK